MKNENKQYTPVEVAKALLDKAKATLSKGLSKSDPRNQTFAQASELNIPQPKAPQAQEKVIAKQPLKLKKFMEKRELKKSGGWKQHPGPSEKDWAPTKKQPEPTEQERQERNKKMLEQMKEKSKNFTDRQMTNQGKTGLFRKSQDK